MGKSSLLLLFIVCSSSVVGEDLIWRQNSNWLTPGNWKTNTLPCGGDSVTFEKSDDPFAVYVDGEVSVKKLTLPKNGRLVLGKKGRIAFSSDASNCKGRNPAGGKGPLVFSPRTNYWDCPENWMKRDGSAPASAPCGKDMAIFPSNNTFSFVSLSQGQPMLSVAGVTLRGSALKSFTTVTDEFKRLNVSINQICRTQPDKCTCPKPGPLCRSPTTAPVTGGGASGGVIAAVIIVVLLVVVMATVAIVAVVCYVRLRGAQGVPYKKDDLNEPTVSFEKEEEGVNFDNPIFDTSSDFSSLTAAEEVPELTVAVEGVGQSKSQDEDLPEKKPF